MSALFNEATTAVIEAVNEEIVLHDDATTADFCHLVLDLRYRNRLYYISKAMARDELWPRLRANDQLLDIVVRASLGFKLRLGDSYLAYSRLMADTYSSITHRPDNAQATSVTDNTFSEKLSKHDELHRLFDTEVWVLFLLTLERNAVKVLPDQLAAKAKAESKK